MKIRSIILAVALTLTAVIGHSADPAAADTYDDQPINQWSSWRYFAGCHWRGMIFQFGSTSGTQIQVGAGCWDTTGTRVTSWVSGGNQVTNPSGCDLYHGVRNIFPSGCTWVNYPTTFQNAKANTIFAYGKFHICALNYAGNGQGSCEDWYILQTGA